MQADGMGCRRSQRIMICGAGTFGQDKAASQENDQQKEGADGVCEHNIPPKRAADPASSKTKWVEGNAEKPVGLYNMQQ